MHEPTTGPRSGGGVLGRALALKNPSVSAAAHPIHLPNSVREETGSVIAKGTFLSFFNTPAVSRTVLPASPWACAILPPSRCTEGS